MKRKPVTDRACPNAKCQLLGRYAQGNVRRHSFYRTKIGRRRRFRCKCCGQTFSSTAGTPYYRLKKSRKDSDDVALMSVEGVSKPSISRIKEFSWNTVARWQELAAQYAGRFNDLQLKNFALIELQANELCTFVDKKKHQRWLLITLEVWSRLWVSMASGRRSHRNVRRLLLDTIGRARISQQFLFTTDGFKPYSWA